MYSNLVLILQSGRESSILSDKKTGYAKGKDDISFCSDGWISLKFFQSLSLEESTLSFAQDISFCCFFFFVLCTSYTATVCPSLILFLAPTVCGQVLLNPLPKVSHLNYFYLKLNIRKKNFPIYCSICIEWIWMCTYCFQWYPWWIYTWIYLYDYQRNI